MTLRAAENLGPFELAQLLVRPYRVAHRRTHPADVPGHGHRDRDGQANLPAQIEIYATDGDAYTFLFMAKGGGSANKSYLREA